VQHVWIGQDDIGGFSFLLLPDAGPVRLRGVPVTHRDAHRQIALSAAVPGQSEQRPQLVLRQRLEGKMGKDRQRVGVVGSTNNLSSRKLHRVQENEILSGTNNGYGRTAGRRAVRTSPSVRTPPGWVPVPVNVTHLGGEEVQRGGPGVPQHRLEHGHVVDDRLPAGRGGGDRDVPARAQGVDRTSLVQVQGKLRTLWRLRLL
jgi:hypothetical protein